MFLRDRVARCRQITTSSYSRSCRREKNGRWVVCLTSRSCRREKNGRWVVCLTSFSASLCFDDFCDQTQ
jgi:hypothetical protein